MQGKRRLVAIAGSLCLAFIATTALVSFMRGVQARAAAGSEPVQVLVAKETIPAGVTAESVASRGLIARKSMPRAAVADGALLSIEDIKDQATVSTILKGEPLLAARFGRAAAAGVLPIPPDRQAMSLEIAVPPGVGGFIQPGDHISIVAQLDVPKAGAAEPRVQYLLQDVPVLSVGRRTVSERSKDGETQVDQQQRVLLTLALPPADVEKLAFAVFQGQVYATLLPSGAKPVGTPGRTRDNAFS